MDLSARAAATQELAALAQFLAGLPDQNRDYMTWYVSPERHQELAAARARGEDVDERTDYSGAFYRDLERLRMRYGWLVEQLARPGAD